MKDMDDKDILFEPYSDLVIKFGNQVFLAEVCNQKKRVILSRFITIHRFNRKEYDRT